jgi:hypothetical protein
MPNTPDENARAKLAFHLINVKYGAWLDQKLMHQLVANDPNAMFYFRAESEFLDRLRRNNKAVPDGCSILGFTVYTPAPAIWINRSRAQPATIVHELLHFLTSRGFRAAVTPKLNEAVTEYFTRKLQRVADARSYEAKVWLEAIDDQEDGARFARMTANKALDQFSGADRQNYAEEHAKLLTATAMAKQDSRWRALATPGQAKPGVLKRAYFAGEQAAIDMVKEAEVMF